MNYIYQLNGFFDSLTGNPISSNAQLLYLHLLNINNRCHWRKDFTAANKTLMALTDLSETQLHRARNELKQKAYIRYQNGSGNQCGTYSMAAFETQTASQTKDNPPGNCKPNQRQPKGNCASLYKQNNNKTKYNRERNYFPEKNNYVPGKPSSDLKPVNKPVKQEPPEENLLSKAELSRLAKEAQERLRKLHR